MHTNTANVQITRRRPRDAAGDAPRHVGRTEERKALAELEALFQVATAPSSPEPKPEPVKPPQRKRFAGYLD